LKINVTFLATFRDVTGTSQTAVDIEGNTVGDVLDALVRVYGDGFKNEILESDGNMKKHVKMFRNGNFIDRKAPLKNPVEEGDTLAIIPPIMAG
jgi:molybdopterin synthase sulfur carrier subunit